MTFPKPGMYRMLGDFYPEGATPQLIAKTIFVAGDSQPPAFRCGRDYSPKNGSEHQSRNGTSSPAQPVAGKNTQLRFTITPGEGLEKYLGAWGHMLAGQRRLIDMMHTHPLIADGSPEMQFDVTFPAPGCTVSGCSSSATES